MTCRRQRRQRHASSAAACSGPWRRCSRAFDWASWAQGTSACHSTTRRSDTSWRCRSTCRSCRWGSRTRSCLWAERRWSRRRICCCRSRTGSSSASTACRTIRRRRCTCRLRRAAGKLRCCDKRGGDTRAFHTARCSARWCLLSRVEAQPANRSSAAGRRCSLESPSAVEGRAEAWRNWWANDRRCKASGQRPTVRRHPASCRWHSTCRRCKAKPSDLAARPARDRKSLRLRRHGTRAVSAWKSSAGRCQGSRSAWCSLGWSSRPNGRSSRRACRSDPGRPREKFVKPSSV